MSLEALKAVKRAFLNDERWDMTEIGQMVNEAIEKAEKREWVGLTDEEIIKMADQAEFVSHGQESEEESELFVCVDKDIYKFAKLVAAHEREACAKLADEYATWGGSNFYDWFKKLAAAIREGEQHT